VRDGQNIFYRAKNFFGAKKLLAASKNPSTAQLKQDILREKWKKPQQSLRNNPVWGQMSAWGGPLRQIK